jgi:hypothetical protein
MTRRKTKNPKSKRMPSKKKTISDRLTGTHKVIDNSLQVPAIMDAVTPFGYPTEQLQAGKALHDAAVAAVHANTVADGAQSLAKARMTTTEKAAFKAYQALSEVAKAIYRKTPERLATIGLNRPMPRKTSPFLVEAFKLFDNAPLKEELVNFGYDATRLASERATIVAYEAAYHEYERAKGAAQDATQLQTAALDAMSDWTSQYLRIAKVALRERPQLLEKLGILVRTGKTAAQRQAPKKAAATRAANKSAEEPAVELV